MKTTRGCKVTVLSESIRMLGKGFLAIVVYLLLLDSVLAQEADDLYKFVRLTNDKSITLAVVQPQAPVQFETLDFLVTRDGKHWRIAYEVENRTRKNVIALVVSFRIQHSIDEWAKFGFGVGYEVSGTLSSPLILGLGKYGNGQSFEETSVLPADIARLFNNKVGNEMVGSRVLCFGMIERVVFEDGSHYEYSSKSFDEL